MILTTGLSRAHSVLTMLGGIGRFPEQKIFDADKILADLPEDLCKLITYELYRPLLEQMPLFAACDKVRAPFF